jgi:DNA-binding GntR family transcriptional regulator
MNSLPFGAGEPLQESSMARKNHQETAVLPNGGRQKTNGPASRPPPARPIRGAVGAGRGLLKERAYAKIKQRILRNELTAAGFLAERQLASQLGMSKTPVRAALERLELEGFVTISPQQGAIIRELSVRDIADQYEVRAALEAFVLRGLAGRLAPSQVARLRANLDAQKANRGARDGERGVALDAEFHLLFCEFFGNQEVLRVMNQLREKIHRVISQVYALNPDRMADSYPEHCAIADAVIRGDADLAAKRIEEHLEAGKQILLSPRR